MRLAARLLAAAACLAQAGGAAAAGAADGSLVSVGSDTVSPLIARWADAFRAQRPRVRIEVQAAGSASAPSALAEGAADLGSMSRPMSDAELASFHRRYGYAPTRLTVAHDAIVVFVHPDNPLRRVTLAELDAIYSDTRRCGAGSAVRRWRELDAGADDLPMLAIGRNGVSGTFELFRETALCGGRYRADVVAWPGNGAIVAAVAGNREAIGYAGIGYVNGLVKPLALARGDADGGVLPDRSSVTDGRYPLARNLYVYANLPPRRAPAGLPAEFLAFALSDDGQALARLEGFAPLSAAERDAQRATLGGLANPTTPDRP
ncbi:MAG TPA: phosphate ABC transporter substrate-binding protein [Dokdonella sp.]